MTVFVSQQAAWLIVFSSMGLANLGRMTRKDAEELLDAYFARIDEAAGRMFPETESPTPRHGIWKD